MKKILLLITLFIFTELSAVNVIPHPYEYDVNPLYRYYFTEQSGVVCKQKELLPLTGYIHGGCSPFGMKKQFMTVVHNTAENMELFYISGGKIGVQIRLSPKELVSAIKGKFEDIVL